MHKIDVEHKKGYVSTYDNVKYPKAYVNAIIDRQNDLQEVKALQPLTSTYQSSVCPL